MRKTQEQQLQVDTVQPKTYLEVDDSSLLGCDTVLFLVQFLILKVNVAPSMSKEVILFSDCLPLKMRRYAL
jgi:hypothetical protein